MKHLLVFVLLVTALSGCLSLTNNAIDQLMKSVPFPESTHLLYSTNVDNGKIALIIDESGFRTAFYSNRINNWNITGNADANPKDGFSWTMLNAPYIPIVIFGGVINDDNITTVLVKQRTLSKQAYVINLNQGRYWYVLFDTLEQPEMNESDPLKIEAIEKNGEVLWKNGIYEDGFFSGRITKQK
ncbi:hypothetical protein [Paenibacillus sabinae]|nr:hypothetical protein [Paenibacillus sabinae]